MTPVLLDESIIRPFVFHYHGGLYQGFAFKQQLFKLVNYFDTGARGEAFALGMCLGEQGQWSVIITAARQRYGVWVEVSADVVCTNVSLFSEDNVAKSTEDSMQLPKL
ncbi:MAG: hypothetical protein AAFX78_02985 [Cyanobacteria bacterium J06638_20]